MPTWNNLSLIKLHLFIIVKLTNQIKMKKILFVAGITVVGLSAAFAQDVKQAEQVKSTKTSVVRAREGQRMSPEEAAQKRTDRLDKQLGLNAEQKKKVHDLFLNDSKERQGRLAQNEKLEAQLKEIFNEEQNQKYEALKSERKQMIQQRIQSARASELKSPRPIK